MVRLPGRSSGLRISTGRRVVVLRRYIGGQGGPVLYDGEQLHRETAYLQWRIPSKIRHGRGLRVGIAGPGGFSASR